MSDIFSPQGYESNEALENTDIVEVYQPTSGGVRRNKQAPLSTLRDFFKKLDVFTPNNIVESDGVGNLRTTSISTTEVSSTIAQADSNTNAIAVNSGNIADNANDIVAVNSRVDGNDTDIATLDGRVTSNDGELATLNSRVNQAVNTNSGPTFTGGVQTDNVKIRHKKVNFTWPAGVSNPNASHGLSKNKILGVHVKIEELSPGIDVLIYPVNAGTTLIITSTQVQIDSGVAPASNKNAFLFITYEA